MEDFLEIVLSLGLMVGFCLLVAQMSKEKDIGFWTLFAVGMLLTPLVSLVVGLVAKKRLKEGEIPASSSTETQEGFLSRFMKKKDNDEKTDNKWKFDVNNPNDNSD
jgi:hypothetical protein